MVERGGAGVGIVRRSTCPTKVVKYGKQVYESKLIMSVGDRRKNCIYCSEKSMLLTSNAEADSA